MDHETTADDLRWYEYLVFSILIIPYLIGNCFLMIPHFYIFIKLTLEDLCSWCLFKINPKRFYTNKWK